MPEEPDSPQSVSAQSITNTEPSFGIIEWAKKLIATKNGKHNFREAVNKLIEETDDANSELHIHEQTLIANILELGSYTAEDVMVPRADITALPHDTKKDDLIRFFSKHPYSRFPVYKDDFDTIIGTIHIKDVLAFMASKKRSFKLEDHVKPVLFISPSLPLLDLMLQMQQKRLHIALIVDEFGSIDGLTTINDVVEYIVGELDDEYDKQIAPRFEELDGYMIADAKLRLDDFLEHTNLILSEDELDNDTIGGLIFDIAGQIPSRGEIIKHDSGMEFEILEADPRRIKRVKITLTDN